MCIITTSIVRPSVGDDNDDDDDDDDDDDSVETRHTKQTPSQPPFVTQYIVNTW